MLTLDEEIVEAGEDNDHARDQLEIIIFLFEIPSHPRSYSTWNMAFSQKALTFACVRL